MVQEVTVEAQVASGDPEVAAAKARAMYPVTADPELVAGAVQVIVADPGAGLAITAVGAAGTVAGAAATLGEEAGPLPAALVAVTSR